MSDSSERARCHRCRGTTGSVTKGSPDSALESPDVEAGRSSPCFTRGGFLYRGGSQGCCWNISLLLFLLLLLLLLGFLSLECIYVCDSVSVSLPCPLSIYSSSQTLAQCPGRHGMQDIRALTAFMFECEGQERASVMFIKQTC